MHRENFSHFHFFFLGLVDFLFFRFFLFAFFLSKQKHLSRRYLRMLIGKCCAKHKHESHIRNLSHFHFHITYFVMLKILIFFVDFKTLDIIFLLYDLLLYFVTTSFTFTIDFSIFLNLLCLFSLLIFFIFFLLYFIIIFLHFFSKWQEKYFHFFIFGHFRLLCVYSHRVAESK